MVFHLPLRQTEGFLHSLARMLEADLPIPDQATEEKGLGDGGSVLGSEPSTNACQKLYSIDVANADASFRYSHGLIM